MADLKEKSDSSNLDELPLIAIKQDYLYRDENDDSKDDGEAPDKKPRLEEKKQRWAERSWQYQNLCRALVDIPEDIPMPVCTTMRCRYVHDIAKYLQTKPPDIDEKCYVYSLRGHCPRGLTCRFARAHITATGRNKRNKEILEQSIPKTLNYYCKELEADLRKRTYNFQRTEEVLSCSPQPPQPTWQGPIDFTADVEFPGETPLVEIPKLVEDRIGPCHEDDLFRLHLAEKRKFDWSEKLVLPAMANFGNLPFRRICKEFGADVTCSEPLVANNILEGSLFDWLLARRHECEDVYGVQLYGNNPFVLTRTTQLVSDQTNADFIDLHFGNPVEPLRFRNKNNMNNSSRNKLIGSIIRCMTMVTKLPLTVFWRLGDFDELVECFKMCEVSMVTMAARKKESKEINWERVDSIIPKLNPVPLMTCSDVLTLHDYFDLKRARPDLAGLLVTRGALVKPWLFEELKTKRDWDIRSSERLAILKRFVNYGLDHWGSDAKGVEVTRRFLLDWLSFLCRYIPIELLEQPPQALNDRCPRYIGRDDLETLMGSQNQQDWIKISEMLLGPVPENFQFIPKVRQGYWPLET